MLKKRYLFLIVIICLFAISAVNATDNATSDIIGIQETTDEVVSVEDSQEILKENNVGTFTELNTTINGNTENEIYLNQDYYYNSSSDSDFIDGITINHPVTIYGNGFTISGENTARIFRVNNENVVLQDITFTNGKTGNGGAIYGYSTAINCTFTNNNANDWYGGAMYQGVAYNCIFANNNANSGGAMYDGDAYNCSFINNSARWGGAMYDGDAYNCSFINNDASWGGAMYDGDAYNCTFTDNDASSTGGAMYDGDAYNCSFINNSAYSSYSGAGGAMYDGDAYNCLFINNSAYDGGAMYDGIAINSNFINNHATNDGGAVYNGQIANSLFEHNSANNNGGAISGNRIVNSTFNHNTANKYGGAIYNAKVSTNTKFKNNTAKEDGNDTYNVTYFDPESTKTFTDLNKLINNDITINTIFLNDNYCYDFRFDVDFIDGISINRPITIYGNGFTISGENTARIFKVSNENVILQDITFTNGTGNGGAINGYSTAINCTFTNNKAYSGGAMYYGSAYNCIFINNMGDGFGGAICSGSAYNCLFINNRASSGGAMYFGDAYNCTFINNSAYSSGMSSGSGGAMSQGDAYNCTFINNRASGGMYGGDGGAMYFGDAYNCSFTNNRASSGGAMYGDSAHNCSFTNNYASSGGAMYRGSAYDCSFTNNYASSGGAMSQGDAYDCSFTNNHANLDGGAIYQINANNCNFINNTADRNGGAMYDGIATNSNFINNYATNDGGAVYNGQIANSLFEYNTADNNGGAISGNMVVNSTFNHNTANKYGGAIYNAKVSTNTKFKNNTAKEDGNDTYNVTYFDPENKKTFTDLNKLINNDPTINTIYLNDDYYYDFIDFYLEGGIPISRNVTIYGNGFTINGENTARIFKVSNENVVLQDITFTNGKTTGDGGAICGYSTVINCTFINNCIAGSYSGGAICFGSAYNCTFINNDACWGGAMSYGDAYNCTFINNCADWDGGAMYEGDAYNCTFTNNNAKYGGAMYLGSAYNCIFINNSAGYYGGGAMYGSYGYDIYYAISCQFIENSATRGGGATYLITANNCNFTKNTAGQNGGAMYGGSAEHCIFNGNIAGEEGNNTYNTIMPEAILSVSNSTSTYYPGDKFAVNFTTDSGIPISDANITIRIYKDNSFIDSYYFLSGDGWIINLDSGEYNAVLSVENQAYIVEPVNTSFKIDKSKIGTTLTVPDVTVAYKDPTGEIVATIISDYGKSLVVNLNFNFNGKDYTVKTDSNGQASIPIGTLSPGKYAATISFKGSKNYKASSTSALVTVTKADTIISASDVSVAYKDPNGELVAVIVSEHGKPLVVTLNVELNGKTYNVKTDSNGQANIAIGTLSPGKYAATISYKGSSNYKASSTSALVTVTKADTIISASDVSVAYKDSNGELVAVIVSEHGKPLVVTLNVELNGKTYNVKTDSNGQASIPVGTLSPGKYTATISYKGSGNYKASTTTAKVTVTKADTIISASDVSVAYKDPNGELVAVIVSEHGKALVVNLNVELNGKTYTVRTDSNGQASIPLDTLTPGTYTATISYKGSSNYKASSTTAKVTVTKADTIISASDVSVAYRDPSGELVATIVSEHGKPLVVTLNVNLNGKDYSVRTDSNGQASIPLGTLTPGTYTATISYKGSANYKASSTTAKVTVTKAGTIITTPDVSVAYGDPNGKLVSTITNEHGKPLVVNLNVELNGKTYKVKSDSNGQISVSTADLAPGTYEAAISYNGSSNYKASSTTANIQVK